MRYFLIFITLIAVLGLASCGSTLPKVKSFKMDIQQGNVVTSKMLLKLRPGMTKRQVKYIMGTPLIEDSFRTNRWDYFYQLRKQGKIVNQRRVILDFEQDLLARVRGDVMPEGTPGTDKGEVMLSKSEVKPEEKSTLDKLKFWKKDAAAVEKEAEGLEPVAVPSALSEAEGLEGETDSTSDVEAASILVVPLPLDPSIEPPPTLLPEVGVSEVTISEGATEAPVGGVTAPEIEVPEVEMVKASQSAPEVVTVEPVAVVPAEIAPVQEQTVMINQKDKLIFRLDRSLDISNLDAGNIVQEATPTGPVVDRAAQQQKRVDKPLPDEEAPGYFERMLEKIGF